jgi:hypothetical protein
MFLVKLWKEKKKEFEMREEIKERLTDILSEEYSTAQLVMFLNLKGSDVISLEQIVQNLENEELDIERAAEKIEAML